MSLRWKALQPPNTMFFSFSGSAALINCSIRALNNKHNNNNNIFFEIKVNVSNKFRLCVELPGLSYPVQFFVWNGNFIPVWWSVIVNIKWIFAALFSLVVHGTQFLGDILCATRHSFAKQLIEIEPLAGQKCYAWARTTEILLFTLRIHIEIVAFVWDLLAIIYKRFRERQKKNRRQIHFWDEYD